MARSSKLPNGLTFGCYAAEDNFQAFATRFFDIFEKLDLPAIANWSTRDRDVNGSDITAVVDAFPRLPSDAGPDPVYLLFQAEPFVNGSINYLPDHKGVALCRAMLQWTTKAEHSADDLIRFQQRCVSMCKQLLKAHKVYWASLRPDSEGFCLPTVPLVDKNSHIAIATIKQAKDRYDDPDEFWNAGWTVTHEQGERRLLTRSIEMPGGPEYLEAILAGQWHLARAAKPAATVYDNPIVAAEEAAIFNAGTARLESVGYDEATETLEYSCVLEKNQHLQGWEIFALRKILADGKSGEGWPVKSIRIVFLEACMAKAEKRPLLDIGCRVFHYDKDGELREIET